MAHLSSGHILVFIFSTYLAYSLLLALSESNRNQYPDSDGLLCHFQITTCLIYSQTGTEFYLDSLVRPSLGSDDGGVWGGVSQSVCL